MGNHHAGLSRRSVAATLPAAAALAAMLTPAAAAPAKTGADPDAELVRLGELIKALDAQEKAAYAALPPDASEAEIEKVSPPFGVIGMALIGKMATLPAATPRGVLAKLHALRWTEGELGGGLAHEDDSPNGVITQSLIGDLNRL